MLIRSQDKRSLAPIEVDGVLLEEFIEKDGHLYDIKHKDTTNGTSVYWITGAGKWLGTYSTESKAIKVLDRIVQAYAEFRGGNIYSGSTFDMPQDSEVGE